MGFAHGGSSNLKKTNLNWMDLARVTKNPIPFDIANLLYNIEWMFASLVLSQ